MATNNAINTPFPIDVASGGTGASTLTDHGVLVGSGTNAITPLSVGTTGQLLVGTTGSDPAFATSADGDFTFTSATAGTNRTVTVRNTDNSSSSAGTLALSVGGASAGDTKIQYTVTGVTDWSTGIDNSATVPSADPFVISASATLGTTNVMEISTDGEINYPLQPAFLGVLETTDSNATGDTTSFTLGSGNALTEIFDQSGDFVTTGTFTAPVTGKYYLYLTATIGDLTTAFDNSRVSILTSNNTFFGDHVNPGDTMDASNQRSNQVAVMCDMDAGDTASSLIEVGNSTKVIDVIGDTASTNSTTYFCGYLAT